MNMILIIFWSYMYRIPYHKISVVFIWFQPNHHFNLASKITHKYRIRHEIYRARTVEQRHQILSDFHHIVRRPDFQNDGKSDLKWSDEKVDDGAEFRSLSELVHQFFMMSYHSRCGGILWYDTVLFLWKIFKSSKKTYPINLNFGFKCWSAKSKDNLEDSWNMYLFKRMLKNHTTILFTLFFEKITV